MTPSATSLLNTINHVLANPSARYMLERGELANVAFALGHWDWVQEVFPHADDAIYAIDANDLAAIQDVIRHRYNA
ncbi:MAG: hypothetical protein HYU74_09970 [Dechloromonas sp.]|nr:hypothetical protein [Dechloromonas sp.]